MDTGIRPAEISIAFRTYVYIHVSLVQVAWGPMSTHNVVLYCKPYYIGVYYIMHVYVPFQCVMCLYENDVCVLVYCSKL